MKVLARCLQGVGPILADVLAAYFFAHGAEVAGCVGRGRQLGSIIPHRIILPAARTRSGRFLKYGLAAVNFEGGRHHLASADVG